MIFDTYLVKVIRSTQILLIFHIYIIISYYIEIDLYLEKIDIETYPETCLMYRNQE